MEDSVSWGYARVSSTSQRLDRQLEQLKAYGIDDRHLKTEKQSGKDFERAEFLSLVGTDEVAPAMRAGDRLAVCSLDRLGRNYAEIQHWWRYITQKLHCEIVVLDMPTRSLCCAASVPRFWRPLRNIVLRSEHRRR